MIRRLPLGEMMLLQQSASAMLSLRDLVFATLSVRLPGLFGAAFSNLRKTILTD